MFSTSDVLLHGLALLGAFVLFRFLWAFFLEIVRSARVATKIVAALIFLTFFLAHTATAQTPNLFFQLDVDTRGNSVTAMMRHNRLTAAAGWSSWTGGHATSLRITHGFDLPQNWTLRAGPTLRRDHTGHTQAGLGLTLERFHSTDTHTLFAMFDINSIDREHMALLEWGHRPSRTSFGVVHQGNASGFREWSLTASHRLPNQPIALRTGVRLRSRTVFVGLVFNTF